MNEMPLAKWMKKTLKELGLGRSFPESYYESEGLCRMETTPPLIVNGAFGGPALALQGRQYCVRR